MKVVAIKCLKCNAVIFSRARHDFRSCICKNCFIDGGFDYIRCGAEDMTKIEHLQINLPNNITKNDLYNDWNSAEDKYGLIIEKVL